MLSSTTPEKPLSGIPFLDRDHAWWLTSIALALRVAFFLFILFRFGDAGFILPPFSDGHGYVTIAENMLAGSGFSRDEAPPYMADTKRVPLYPLFLSATFALTGGAWWLAALLQTLMSAALVYFVYRATAALFGKPAAFFAGLITALYPFQIFISSQLLAETLFTLLLFGGFVLFMRSFSSSYRSVIAAGVVIGLATLVKPAGQYIPFLLAPFMAFGRHGKERLLYPAVFIVCFLLTISPWIIRNNIAAGVPTLSYEANILFDLHLAGYRAFTETGTASRFPEYRNAKSEDDLLAVSRSSYMRRVVSAAIHDPIGFTKYLAITTVPFVLGDGFVTMVVALSPDPTIPAWDFSASGSALSRTIGFGVLPPGLVILSIMSKAFWGFVLIVAFAGFIRLLRTGGRDRLIGLAMALVIAYFMFAGGPVQSARYRMPVEPLIFVMAGVGIVELVTILEIHRRKRRGLPTNQN